VKQYEIYIYKDNSSTSSARYRQKDDGQQLFLIQRNTDKDITNRTGKAQIM
jgi:hypothetical protein